MATPIHGLFDAFWMGMLTLAPDRSPVGGKEKFLSLTLEFIFMRKSSSILAILVLLLATLSGTAGAQPAKGLNELGVMAFQAGRFPVALEHFEKALTLEPNNPSLRRNLCAVHQAMANELAAQGKFSEALERVSLGLKVDPDNAAALAQVGAYQLQQGNRSEATTALKKAVGLDGANKEARFLLGEVLYQQNKLADARAQWEAVLKLDPAWPGLQEKLAKLDRESTVEQDFNQYDAGHFQLRYAKALSESTRNGVFEILESAYTAVGAKLGGAFPPEAVPVVLYDGEQFTEATQSPGHVGALYDGKIRSPITGHGGRFLDAQVLSTRLTHEYVHVLLAQLGNGRVPWWLNEGLAEVFSREMDQSRKRMLKRAYGSKKEFSLADLETRQLDKLEPEKLALAYAQAHATASLLWELGGMEKLVDALKRIKNGASAEGAIQKAYGVDYATLEQKVAAVYCQGAADAQP